MEVGQPTELRPHVIDPVIRAMNTLKNGLRGRTYVDSYRAGRATYKPSDHQLKKPEQAARVQQLDMKAHDLDVHNLETIAKFHEITMAEAARMCEVEVVEVYEEDEQ